MPFKLDSKIVPNFISQITILENEFERSFYEFDRSNSSFHHEDESHKDQSVGPEVVPKEPEVDPVELESDPLKGISPKPLRASSDVDSNESLLNKSGNLEVNPIEDADKLLGPDLSFDFDRNSSEEAETHRNEGLDETEEGKKNLLCKDDFIDTSNVMSSFFTILYVSRQT